MNGPSGSDGASAAPNAGTGAGAGIGVLDGFTLVVGSMIGSGIFIVSAESARLVGTPGRLLAVWTVAGALTVLASLSCAELAVRHPEAGGPYVFLEKAFGPFAGFLYGWALVAVVQTGTIAAVAVAFARFLAVLVPSLGGAAEKGVAIALLALLTLANAYGLALGTRIQNVLTAAKVAALVLLAVACWTLAPAAPPPAAHPAATPPEGFAFVLAFAAAMVGPLFSQSAWTNVTFPGAEVRDPARTFPRALVGGCALVAALYVFTNAGYLRVLGLGGVAHAPAGRVGTAASESLLPGAGGLLMATAILVSTAGCLNGLVLSGGRVLFALARDGRGLAPLAARNARGVPGRALAVQAAWAALLVLSGTYSDLLKYVISAELLLSVALVLAVPVLRRKAPGDVPAFSTPGYPVTPWLYAIPALVLSGLLLVASPRTNGPGLALLASAVPVYFLWRRR